MDARTTDGTHDVEWEHRIVDGKVQVHIPYPIDLWAGCLVPEHDPRNQRTRFKRRWKVKRDADS